MYHQDELYPPGPREVPADLTAPTAAYKRSSWLAFAGLIAFVLLYVGLTGYFGWLVYRLVRDSLHSGTVGGFFLAIPPLLFGLFLLRGLFVVKHTADPTRVEVREEDEPALFAFVRRIADDTGAPRPHRVFLSARVNAAVFYDLSFRNLLFPSRKNLEIGLGLVNALSLDELKAVVAHEFGHFAQRTMAIGRWVYMAQQIVGHIVATRSWLDSVLGWISRIDLRVAWIGWIMRLFVWAIRAVLDTAFRIIILAHRALSREMELQADLVSVSVSGSDSLIHALHRLGPADDAWERAVGFAGGQAARKKPVADLFAVQEKVLDRLRWVLNDDSLGATPALPERRPEAHRVFEEELAQPPRMWSTHPPNGEREANAKKLYLPSKLDPRSAWALFRDPAATRRAVTQRFAEAAFGEAKDEPAPIEESLALIDEDYAIPSLDRRYRGAYLNRTVVGAVAQVADLYAPIGAEQSDGMPTARRRAAPEGGGVPPRSGATDVFVDEEPEAIVRRLDALYPESLKEQLERASELRREQSLLTALQDGILSAPGGVIRYRGREIPRKQLTEVIERVKREHTEADNAVLAHDRACRTAHRIAARRLGGGWEDYLVSLASLLHYADHASADVRDAIEHMHHVLNIVTADGHVSSGERVRLLSACQDVWNTISAAFSQREDVALPARVRETLEAESWMEALAGGFDLSPPHDQNLGDWLRVVDSWAYSTSDTLGALASRTLEALLEAEAEVERALREGAELPEAPQVASAPRQYSTLVLGQERERQKKLGWWDRFQLADGFVPGAARLAVASGLLLPAMLFTGSAGEATVTIYNGLGIPVEVSIDGESEVVSPRGVASIDVATNAHAQVVARASSGREIERFEADADYAWGDYVYNVASASPLVEWTASYGSASERPERPLGTVRWHQTSVDAIFTEPPRSVSLPRGSSGTTRDALAGLADAPPMMQVGNCSDPAERQAMIEAHLRWDPSDDPKLGEWMSHVEDEATLLAIVRERLEAEPGRVLWLRLEQDAAGDARAEVCARHRELAAAAPESADYAYLATRCIEDEAARDAAFVEQHQRHLSHPWLAMAAGYEHAGHARWDEALSLLSACRIGETSTFFSAIAIDVARIRRVRAEVPSAVVLDDLIADSQPLRFLLSFDGIGVPPGDPASELFMAPWRSLARGELEGVLGALAMDPNSAPAQSTLLRLVAASDGATPAMVAEAFALAPDAGINARTVWPTMALAVREGRDPQPFIAFARENAEEESEAMISLLDAGPLAADPSGTMHGVVAGLDPVFRGHALVMGIVLLGDAAPAEWRHDARALLFTSERPYFR